MSGRNRGGQRPQQSQDIKPSPDANSPVQESQASETLTEETIQEEEATQVESPVVENESSGTDATESEETSGQENATEEIPVPEERKDEASAESNNASTVEKASELTVSTAAGSETISSSRDDVDVNAGLTKIKIGYPKDFKGKKFFEQDEVKFVSREVADQFVDLGIACIVE